MNQREIATVRAALMLMSALEEFSELPPEAWKVATSNGRHTILSRKEIQQLAAGLAGRVEDTRRALAAAQAALNAAPMFRVHSLPRQLDNSYKVAQLVDETIALYPPITTTEETPRMAGA